MGGQRHILVIKLSALGDFIQAMGPFAAIRAHHAADRVILLTTRAFAGLAARCPYFDDVWIDERPRLWDVPGMMRLKKKLRSVKFEMVYDLQTSDRSSSYFHIMGGPPWSGIAHNCSHPHANPDRDFMHTLDRQAEQLAMAGISPIPSPDLSWLTADIGRFRLPSLYALIVPGGAPHRPAKRWPAERFAALCQALCDGGVLPVLLGTADDRDQIEAITKVVPLARSLAGETELADIAQLARGAAGAVGNDTGPMHLVAAAGCPAVVLFSDESNPGLCAPRGLVGILHRADLADLPLEEVLAALKNGPAALRGDAASI